MNLVFLLKIIYQDVFVECVNCLELGKLQEKNTKNTKNSPKITRVKYEGGPPQLPLGSKIYLELRITFFGWTGLYNFYNILLFDSENC